MGEICVSACWNSGGAVRCGFGFGDEDWVLLGPLAGLLLGNIDFTV